MKTSRRAFLLELAAFGALAAGCRERLQPEPHQPGANILVPPPKVPLVGASPRLLAGALFTSAGVDAKRGLLATASAQITGETPGQVVTWDVHAGQPVDVVDIHDGAGGWDGHSDLLQWAPEGRRLAVATGTNATTVIENGTIIGELHLDQGRDHPVDFCWADGGDTLFVAAPPPKGSALGGMVSARSQAFKEQVRWIPPHGQQELSSRMVWNPRLDAIIGVSRSTLVSFDVKSGRLRYAVGLNAPRPAHIRARLPCLTRDGSLVAVAGPNGVNIRDGSNGRVLHAVPLTDPVASMTFGPNHALAVVTQTAGSKSSQTVHLIGRGRVVQRFDAPLLRWGVDLHDAPRCVWSPAEDAVALRLEGKRVRIVDAATGKTRNEIKQGVPPDSANGFVSSGVLWPAPDRLVGLSREQIVFWAPDGKVIAEHRVA